MENTIEWFSKVKHKAISKLFHHLISLTIYISFACADSLKNICQQLLPGRIDKKDTNSSQPSLNSARVIWLPIVKLTNLILTVCFSDMKTFSQHMYFCIFVMRTFVHSFAQQCQSVPFHREIGFALDGHVIETNLFSPDDCLWHCRATVNCFSVNVRKVTHAVVIFLSFCQTKVNYMSDSLHNICNLPVGS